MAKKQKGAEMIRAFQLILEQDEESRIHHVR
jgi:hypothetical protein